MIEMMMRMAMAGAFYRADVMKLRNLSNFGNLPLARRTTARMEYGHNNFTTEAETAFAYHHHAITHLLQVSTRSIGALLATRSESGYNAAFHKSRRRGVLPSQLWHSPAGRRGRSMQVSYNSSPSSNTVTGLL
jgi:hypothetical protein